MLGQHCVKHSSNLQSTVSLSSGESEFYALVKAGQAGLGLRALFTKWQVPVKLTLLSGSGAAKEGTGMHQTCPNSILVDTGTYPDWRLAS